MTIQEDIELFAVSAKKFGAKVEINYSLPTIEVVLEENSWFVQGEEASTMLQDAEMFGGDIEDVILWFARGW